MSLRIGDRIGPYDITGRLGAGGMGEVFRARDTRLGRDVALKVLPSGFTADTKRRARFEQEARSAAALNHPHIVALFDVGIDNSSPYLVSELIEGETLAAILARGPLPLRKVLALAVDLADALGAAHSQAIVHRDVKPGNVLVTKDGRAKLLDFGLARGLESEPPADGSSFDSQAGEDRLTLFGRVVGTPAYMSPEQVAGRAADFRSDQFSFGLLLFEMVTGQRASDRPTAAATMNAILRGEPPSITRPIPAPLRWIIDRCLAREVEDRYDSTRDLHRELRYLRDHVSEILTGSGEENAALEERRRRWPRWRTGLFAAAIASAGAAAFTLGWRERGATALDPADFHHQPISVDGRAYSGVRFSPDGQNVAYMTAQADGTARLMLRPLDQPSARELIRLPGRESPSLFAWFPDGQNLAFSRQRGDLIDLLRMPSVGGEPSVFASIPYSWMPRLWRLSPDGRDLVAAVDGSTDARVDPGLKLLISSPAGSPWKPYPNLPFARDTFHRGLDMDFSPDGKKLLLSGISANGVRLWLIPYPPDPGKPVRQVVQDVVVFGRNPLIAWMPDSRRVVASYAPRAGANPSAWMMDLESGAVRSLMAGTNYAVLGQVVSPRGDRLAYLPDDSDFDLIAADLLSGAVRPFRETLAEEQMPDYAPQLRAIVYS